MRTIVIHLGPCFELDQLTEAGVDLVKGLHAQFPQCYTTLIGNDQYLESSII